VAALFLLYVFHVLYSAGAASSAPTINEVERFETVPYENDLARCCAYICVGATPCGCPTVFAINSCAVGV
jgi:hypothetical protein